MIYRFILFLFINFAALGIGGIFTGEGVPSEWYQSLNKAPWTPPGWVFGAAWSTIMICLTFYITIAWKNSSIRKLILILFSIQWILNVGWNPVFFHFHYMLAGLIVISLLTLLVGFFLFYFWKDLKYKSLLMAPYFIWLLIAVSLNAYILINN